MKKLLFTFLLLAGVFALSAQPAVSPQLRFGRIGLERGLSQSTVFVTYQDSQGYLWFGTEDGLNKYNGYNFDVYKFDPTDSASISNNIVRCIQEDKDGDLWIGTDNGLNRYNRHNGSFTRFLHDPSNARSLSNNLVSGIVQDKAGILWIGTANGLNALDPATGNFTTYRSTAGNPVTLSGNTISTLMADRSGTIWVGTSGSGLNAWDPVSKKAIRYLAAPGQLSENDVVSLAQDRQGVVWIGTVNGGLNSLSANGKFRSYTADHNELPNNSVFSIHEDRQGVLWVGTLGGGLVAMNAARTSQRVYRHDVQNAESVSGNKVWSIFEDAAGTLWFGTSNGISYYNRTIAKFVTHRPSQTDDSNNNSVFSVFEDPRGICWTGVLGGGVHAFDRKENRFVDERFPFLADPRLRFSNPFSLLVDNQGTLWVGTNDGLLSVDPRSGSIVQYRNAPSDPGSLPNNYVRTLYQDRAGTLWIGTHGGGLARLRQGKFDTFRNDPKNKSSIPGNVVMHLLETRDGKFWVATYGGGLAQFDRNTGTFTAFRFDIRNAGSISSDFVNDLHEDAKGRLWVATYGGGLNRMESNSSFTHFTERDGLPNNVINGILEDRKGFLWVSSNNGVFKFQTEGRSLSTHTYNVQDGLQFKFNEGACFAGAGGWMYFGGSSGLNAFHPDSINDNSFIPPVVITRFYLFEKPARMDTLITSNRTLDLSYKQNFFTFEFAALNFLFPEKNRYMYKMENLNEDWIYAGDRRYATYTNIDPGTYTFRVKACNNDGVWNDEGISILITIRPPFYSTWWFRALAAIAITLIIFLYIRLRTNALMKQNVILEDKVTQRTQELQEKNVELTKTMDDLRATQDQLVQSEKMASLGQLTAGIAHEIQNPLNFVNNFSELSMELLDELGGVQDRSEQGEIIGDLKQNLEKIVFHGKRADGIVKGMLQHSRAATAEKQSTDINRLVEEYCSLAYHGIRAKDPAFNCTIERNFASDLPHARIIPQDISRVILNIVNNAFYAVDERKRSGDKQFKPTVSIATRREGERLLISIRDNGTGIPGEIRDKIFNPFFTTKPTGQGTGLGLSISYDIIVKGHRGDLQVESQPGSFTEFRIYLPVS